MSELMNTRHTNVRHHLLISVSALALTASVYAGSNARADDADRPTVWIELGGQFEHVQDLQEAYLPHFVSQGSSFAKISPSAIERPVLTSLSGDGKIEFQPEDSDWVFSGAVRFGRSSGSRHQRQETVARAKNPVYPQFGLPLYITATQTKLFGDVASRKNETHAVVDFSAGKDLGLGMFGRNSRSVVSAGIRFAQFTDKSSVDISAVPTVFMPKYSSHFHTNLPVKYPNNFRAEEHCERSFHGIGPSFSWDASEDVMHNDEAQFTFDLGVNASLLFGHQKSRVHAQTAEYRHPAFYLTTTYNNHPPDRSRIRTVAVPNVGGFAGLSLKFPNAKLSIGYRGDFFFGAMDGGIDVAKKENVGFYGPFATINIGLGG